MDVGPLEQHVLLALLELVETFNISADSECLFGCVDVIRQSTVLHTVGSDGRIASDLVCSSSRSAGSDLSRCFSCCFGIFRRFLLPLLTGFLDLDAMGKIFRLLGL